MIFPKARFVYDDIDRIYVCGVQDTFGGNCYRQLRRAAAPGEIITRKLRHFNDPGDYGTSGDGMSITNFRIVEEVHPNVIHAFLRSVELRRTLRVGYWYRVIED